jgi:hypothetical protein
MIATPAPLPPPTKFAQVGFAHARPVAGRSFTGLTVTPLNGATIQRVVCDGLVRGSTLRGRKYRFYAATTPGPSAVTCGWKVPAKVRGPLSVQVAVVTDMGTMTFPVTSWRIRHVRLRE